MLLFIKEYGIMILTCVCVLLELFLLIVKRKPKTLDDFLEYLHHVAADVLPVLISDVEEPGKGKEKKSFVMLNSMKVIQKKLGRKLSKKEEQIFNDYISHQIELILSTPTKKGAL